VKGVRVKKEKNASLEKESNEPKGFFDRYGANIILVALFLYVILLLTGTIAEIFHIDSILNWWIWRPVGK
jgi:hypothetical protein